MSKKDKVVHAKLIANPGAGKPEEAPKQLELAIRYLKQHGIEVNVALAKPKEEATPLAKQAVKDGYEMVIAMGGDGTLEAVLRGLVGRKTPMGIIPIGTQNNVAKSLGIPTNLGEACALIAEKHIRKLDVGRVKVKNGKKLFFFELQEPEPDVFLTLDDESKIEVKTMLVVVSNAPMFGANFLVAPDASLNDGLLDVSVYPNFSKTELLAYYAQIRAEGFSPNEKVQRYRACKLEIKSDPKMDVMADGVMLGKGKVEIKSKAGALWIITPEDHNAPPALVKDVSEELPAPISPVPVKEPEPTLST